MLKKVLFIVISFLILIIIFMNISSFNFDFSEIQRDSIKFILKSYLIISTLCFILGEITKNYSQIDKVWSLVPIYVSWLKRWTLFILLSLTQELLSWLFL